MIKMKPAVSKKLCGEKLQFGGCAEKLKQWLEETLLFFEYFYWWGKNKSYWLVQKSNFNLANWRRKIL